MKKLLSAAKYPLIGALLAVVLIQARDRMHLFAPALVYHCPPGHTLVTRWEKGTAAAGQPGTVVYHGWTEWASCSQSMTIDGG